MRYLLLMSSTLSERHVKTHGALLAGAFAGMIPLAFAGLLVALGEGIHFGSRRAVIELASPIAWLFLAGLLVGWVWTSRPLPRGSVPVGIRAMLMGISASVLGAVAIGAANSAIWIWASFRSGGWERVLETLATEVPASLLLSVAGLAILGIPSLVLTVPLALAWIWTMQPELKRSPAVP